MEKKENLLQKHFLGSKTKISGGTPSPNGSKSCSIALTNELFQTTTSSEDFSEISEIGLAKVGEFTVFEFV